jgi:hypothetical protein
MSALHILVTLSKYASGRAPVLAHRSGRLGEPPYLSKRRRVFGKPGKAIGLARDYASIMRAFVHKDSFPRGIAPFDIDSYARRADREGWDSGRCRHKSARLFYQLVWVLITLLLLLYLATSYVYWAKIESAWPIFR